MSDSDRSNSSSALNLSQASVLDIVKEGKRVIAAFLRETQCYDVIKNSGKVVVFDVKIPINLAFFALVEHGVVVNIYCVSNVTELVKDRSLTQLDMPVGEILRIQAAEVR
ncbi:hypothetical protein AM588_10001885 [Phytophthora nicotianae]|uniref:Uncharacterized protein n=1 Tax=Phytophthora nicotianae TaxID=4792 RepID=A0A0W8CSB3_PHYNI|nr:hypothetical protein AM588_10001885 [Phytophthora nicotianae]